MVTARRFVAVLAVVAVVAASGPLVEARALEPVRADDAARADDALGPARGEDSTAEPRVDAGLALPVVRETGESAGLMREELLEHLRARWRAIESLRVVVRQDDDIPGRAPGAYVRNELAWLGGDRFFHDMAHGSDLESWEVDYGRERSRVTGRRYHVDKPNQRVFLERELRAEELPERFAFHPFLAATGFWPEPATLRCPAVPGMPISLWIAARDPSYRLGERLIDVDGARCVELEKPGVDRVLLDVDHGLALRHREWRDADTGALRLGVVVDTLERLGDDVWVPRAFRMLGYDGVTAGLEGAPPPVPSVRAIDVVEIELGTLDSSWFVYDAPPGAFRIDHADEEKWTQVVPGGLDFLEHHGALLQARFADRDASRSRLGPWALAGAFAGVLLGVRRRGRERGDRDPPPARAVSS